MQGDTPLLEEEEEDKEEKTWEVEATPETNSHSKVQIGAIL